MPYTDEEFDKVFATLPEDVKEAMSSVNTVNIMMEMKTKYDLHIDQLGELSAEVGMLMLGAIHPQEFIGKVEAGLRIPRETAKLIAAEVNEKIFRPVRDSLIQIHKMKKPESESPATVSAPMPSGEGEIPEAQSMKGDTKNTTRTPFPERTLPKETTGSTPPEPIILPKNNGVADPYREKI